jgi:hypothetical protein
MNQVSRQDSQGQQLARFVGTLFTAATVGSLVIGAVVVVFLAALG